MWLASEFRDESVRCDARALPGGEVGEAEVAEEEVQAEFPEGDVAGRRA